MAWDYDHPSERRPHIEGIGEGDLSTIVSVYYHDLLVKTYKNAEEKLFKNFIKICHERNISQSVMSDFVDWLNYNYRTNANRVNGAINDYVCLLLLLLEWKRRVVFGRWQGGGVCLATGWMLRMNFLLSELHYYNKNKYMKWWWGGG